MPKRSPARYSSPSSYFFAFTFVIAIWLSPSPSLGVEAFEPPPATWLPNSWGFSLTGDYFQSDSNYDVNRGSKVSLGNGNYLNTVTSHLRGRYAITNRFGLFAGAGLAQTAMKDIGSSRSATSFTDLSAGVDLLLTKRIINLILEAQAGYPMDYVYPTQTKPLTSDGSPFGRIGLFAIKPLRYLRLSGYLGFDYPTFDLSKKLLYQVNIEAPLSQFLIGGGINGSESIVDDAQNLLARQTTEAQTIGGSERFYAYNPGVVEARAWIGFRPDQHWSLRVGYGQTLNGVRAAAGSSILFSVSFNAQDLFGPSVDELENEARGDDASRGFEPTVEKTDQSLFRDEVPPPKPRKRPANSRHPRAQTPSAGDSLDATERILEKDKR